MNNLSAWNQAVERKIELENEAKERTRLYKENCDNEAAKIKKTKS